MNADAFSKTLNDVTYREPERIFLYICWNYEGCFGSQKTPTFRFESLFDVTFGVTLGVKKKKARGLTPLTCAFDGGRYKIRTCDPIRVKDMLYP